MLFVLFSSLGYCLLRSLSAIRPLAKYLTTKLSVDVRLERHRWALQGQRLEDIDSIAPLHDIFVSDAILDCEFSRK